ncbi:ferritin [Fonticella tunisiensis]|uniref:Ferritin n=1 Tax=Fonticella tunisiensis TaxID=1096341 RepID=A0A4V3EUH5_9CLOT|nr:ferritin [Fonticella tunisiensis]TDT63295.1 ferritin [Fonticella tunisiensis]
MIGQRLIDELNKQLTRELESAHTYIAISAYFHSEDLPGFANFFMVQSDEERFHAMKIFNYINQINERIKIGGIEAPKNDFSSILDAFNHAFEHEKALTTKIYNLMDIAAEEREYATISFLKWFVDEQIEEQDLFNGIIKKLERIQNDPAAIYMLDSQLAQRAFTPPAADSAE